MADKARQQTDKRLAEMEKYLTSIYRESAKGIYEKWNEFMSEANDKLSKLQKEYDDAKATGDKVLMKKTGVFRLPCLSAQVPPATFRIVPAKSLPVPETAPASASESGNPPPLSRVRFPETG